MHLCGSQRQNRMMILPNSKFLQRAQVLVVLVREVEVLASASASEAALEMALARAPVQGPLPTVHLPPAVSLDSQTNDQLLDCEARRMLNQWHQ